MSIDITQEQLDFLAALVSDSYREGAECKSHKGVNVEQYWAASTIRPDLDNILSEIEQNNKVKRSVN